MHTWTRRIALPTAAFSSRIPGHARFGN